MLLRRLGGILNYRSVPMRFGVVEAVNGNIEALSGAVAGTGISATCCSKQRRLAALKAEFVVRRKAA